MATATPSPPLVQPPPPPPSRPWGAGRIIATVAASVFLLLGLGLIVGGAGVKIADATLREDGYLMGNTTTWQSPGYAVRSESAQIHTDSTEFDLPDRILGKLRVTADPGTANGVFVGVARTADVDRYLRGVATSTIKDPFGGARAETTFVDGGSPRVAPTDATFWEASAAGTGEQTITWKPRAGDWTLVVMNGEGTTPVSADVAVGAELPVLGTVGIVMLVVGLVMIGASGIGLWLALRRGSTGGSTSGPAGGWPGAPTTAPTTGPTSGPTSAPTTGPTSGGPAGGPSSG